jgi:hypothetical protein
VDFKCRLGVEATVVVDRVRDRWTRFWDNSNFGMTKKPLGYGVQCAELECDAELMRMENTEIVELV